MSQVTSWVCSGLSILILLLRILVSHGTPHVTKLSQILCVCSILVITMRIPVVYFTLQFGTAGDLVTNPSKRQQLVPQQVGIGSRLVLFARILATTYFWLQVSLLLRFYMRVLSHIPWVPKAIRVAWMSIFTTYAVCLLVTFLECRPFSRYWQIDPAPDRCTLAYAQIFTQGVTNILLDVVLLVIAFPLITYTKKSTIGMIKVTILVVLGAVCIVVTGLKLATVVASDSQQKARTLWASIQVLVSTFVANVPTIYGCVRLRFQHRNSRKDSAANNLTLTRTPSCPFDQYDEFSEHLPSRLSRHSHGGKATVVHEESAA